MRNLALKSFYSISDLREQQDNANINSNIKQKRGDVLIAVIDDKTFEYQANLQNYGYNVTTVGDIRSVDEVRGYHIILCDIMGVGVHFDKKLQGASLIQELKRSFPEKIIIAYTGGSNNDRSIRIASQRADAILKKDLDIEEWINSLDKFAVEVTDPCRVWQRIRARFVEMEIDTKTILILEDAFVRSIRRGDQNFNELKRALDMPIVGENIRAILNSIIAAMVFKVLFG